MRNVAAQQSIRVMPIHHHARQTPHGRTVALLELTPARRTRAAGFTVVEMMAVMAIIVVLTAAITPVIRSVGGAGTLTGAGDEVVNLINLARQNSMTKNAMTALILVTDPAIADHHRVLGLFELVPPPDGSAPLQRNWTQVGSWEQFGTGAFVDVSTLSAYPATAPSPNFPALQYEASPLASWQYVIFMPEGNLLTAGSSQLRVAEGFFPPHVNTPIYTHPGPGQPGVPANYYNVVILADTGRVKVERP